MLKTYLYISDNLNERVTYVARIQKKSKAEVIRQALEKGLEEGRPKSGAESLLKLAEIGRRFKLKGPRDASINHDYYLWGLPKKDPRIKP